MLMLRKEQMRKLTLAARDLIIIKDLILRLGEDIMLLVRVKEDVMGISNTISRLMARRAVLEYFISSRISSLIDQPVNITHLTKKQLEEGYINLTSLDGDEHIGDYILYLTTGDVIQIVERDLNSEYVLPRQNALVYHRIIQEEIT